MAARNRVKSRVDQVHGPVLAADVAAEHVSRGQVQREIAIEARIVQEIALDGIAFVPQGNPVRRFSFYAFSACWRFCVFSWDGFISGFLSPSPNILVALLLLVSASVPGCAGLMSGFFGSSDGNLFSENRCAGPPICGISISLRKQLQSCCLNGGT
jgi:hypothetical protein